LKPVCPIDLPHHINQKQRNAVILAHNYQNRLKSSCGCGLLLVTFPAVAIESTTEQELLSIVGISCGNSKHVEPAKNRLILTAGLVFSAASIMVLMCALFAAYPGVPVCLCQTTLM